MSRKSIKLIGTMLIFSMIALTTSCQKEDKIPKTQTKTFLAMDTTAKITIYDDNNDDNKNDTGNENEGKSLSENDKIAAIDAAFEWLGYLDRLFSYDDPNGELFLINKNAAESPIELTDQTAILIELSKKFAQMTNGAFDITIGALIELWGNEEFPPYSVQIEDLLPHLGDSFLNFDSPNKLLSFSDDRLKLHFGGIAKGFAVQEMLDILKGHGVSSAIIEFGGEIGVLGKSYHDDGLWTIGIIDPLGNEGETIENILINPETYVATSGLYERPSHIFNPKTGYPVESGLASVTVISEIGAYSDALATALMVDRNLNLEGAWRYCAIFIDEGGEVIYNHYPYTLEGEDAESCYFCNNPIDDSGDSGSTDN